jgi:hypothetical protein
MHWGSDFRKMSRSVAATKAVEAMVVKENFIQAEVNGEGAVFGYNEDSAAVVFTIPVRDGVQIYMVVASRSNDEAARLRSSIRSHVFDAPYNSRIPNKMTSNTPGRKAQAPAMHLGGDARPLSLAAFQASGQASLTRLVSNAALADGGRSVSGSSSSAITVAFYLPLDAKRAFISVVAAAGSFEEAAYLQSAVRADILRASAKR